MAWRMRSVGMVTVSLRKSTNRSLGGGCNWLSFDEVDMVRKYAEPIEGRALVGILSP